MIVDVIFGIDVWWADGEEDGEGVSLMVDKESVESTESLLWL